LIIILFQPRRDIILNIQSKNKERGCISHFKGGKNKGGSKFSSILFSYISPQFIYFCIVLLCKDEEEDAYKNHAGTCAITRLCRHAKLTNSLTGCRTQQLNFRLRIKSLTESGKWYMIDITAENWPVENHAGGFSFSTAATVFFANSSVGVALSPCERCALSRIASSNGLYNFHSGIWL